MILAVAVSFDEITVCHVQLNVSKIIKKKKSLICPTMRKFTVCVFATLSGAIYI